MKIVALVFACFVAANMAIGCEVGVSGQVWQPFNYPICPQCKESHYTTRTEYDIALNQAVYRRPEYRKGEMVYPKHKPPVTWYICLECGNEWRE